MTKASDNAFPSLLITEGTEPSAPAAGKQRLYIDSTSHHLMRTNSSGTETDIEAAAGGMAADPLWDAAGDLAVATGANTAAKLTVGADGTVLTVSPSTHVPVWSAPTGGVTHTTQGTTSAGASFKARGTILKKLTLASAGLVTAIHVFVKGDGSAQTVILPIIYSDVSGTPTNIIYSPGGNITGAPARVYGYVLNTTVRDLALPCGVWLAAADYWFGVWTSDASGTTTNVAYTGTGGTGAYVSGGTINQPEDSSIQALTTNSEDYSIYIDVIR